MPTYDALQRQDPAIFQAVMGEIQRQAEGVELIPSENYISAAVMETMASVFNNKYSEGYPGRRYYGGQKYTDQVETLAIERAKALFGAGHANVQPHAGAPANIATYFALLEPGDTVLGMDLSHGGHLTHGHPVTYITKIYNFVRYKMKDIETGEIDYDEMREVALREKPKIVLAGFSAYPREIDYARMKAIAEEAGAYAVADMAHIAGLIAGKAVRNPFDDGFDVILTTTHKTLRGPRGGMILTREAKLGKRIDRSVFPGFQGGPIMQMIAAKAGRLRRGAEAGIRRLCATDRAERQAHGREVHAVRRAPHHQRHRQSPPDDRLREFLESHRRTGRGTLRPGRHHPEQERHRGRPSQAAGSFRNPAGDARRDHAGHGQS